MIHETMQDRIKRLLNERDISIRDFARMVDCSEVTMARILSPNTKMINKEHLISISNILGVSTDWLLGLTNDKTESKRQSIDIFISLPMMGRTTANIEAHIASIKEYARSMKQFSTYDLGFMHNLDYEPRCVLAYRQVGCLAGALDKMSLCDAIIFGKGWEEARGCVIEHEVAAAYWIPIYYEGES